MFKRGDVVQGGAAVSGEEVKTGPCKIVPPDDELPKKPRLPHDEDVVSSPADSKPKLNQG